MRKMLRRLRKRIVVLFSEFLCKIKRFKEKRFLLCTIIVNIVLFLFWGVLYLRRRTIPWAVIIGFPAVSIVICFEHYARDFLSWCRSHNEKTIEKTIQTASAAFIFISPLISFIVSYYLATLYFEKPLTNIDITCCCFIIFSQFIFVSYYCVELKDATNPKLSSVLRAKLFLVIIIHIAQLFADIYIILYKMFPNSFIGIDASSAFSICFDFTYFSLMTLLTADSDIIVMSRLAKSVVLIETLLFVIVISMVIFGIFFNDTEQIDIDK